MKKFWILFILLSLYGVSVSQPCQHIDGAFDTTACIPVPVAEEGFLYFNNCIDDSILFVAKGYYPQNFNSYSQHDSLSTFHWDFGDGVTLTTLVPFVKHKYNLSKGYDMHVIIKDSINCSSIPVLARVRISGNPITGVSNPAPGCIHDTVYLVASKLSVYQPFNYTQVSSQRYDSTTFIPDGQNTCPPYHYVTDVVFTSFLPSQTITQASDILSVCANMEHGYMGDISMKLICPNGQQAMLKGQGSGGGKYMGQPACWFSGCSLADVRSCDHTDSICNPAYNPPGIGWNYCWSQFYPTVGQVGNQATIGTNQIDSTHIAAGTGYFDPSSSFANLVGCPLNGLWTIDITDHAGADNGYIFEWTLNLDPALLPVNWGYQVNSNSPWCEGPDIVGYSGDTAIVVPSTVGSQDYVIKLLDEYNCLWDTTVTLVVNPLPQVSLPTEVDFCPGGSAVLQSSAPCVDCSYNWNTGDKTPSITVSNQGLYILEVLDPNECSNTDTTNVIVHPTPSAIPIKHN